MLVILLKSEWLRGVIGAKGLGCVEKRWNASEEHLSLWLFMKCISLTVIISYLCIVYVGLFYLAGLMACPDGTLRFCTISDGEQEKCLAMMDSFSMVNISPTLSCFPASSHSDCMIAIAGKGTLKSFSRLRKCLDRSRDLGLKRTQNTVENGRPRNVWNKNAVIKVFHALMCHCNLPSHCILLCYHSLGLYWMLTLELPVYYHNLEYYFLLGFPSLLNYFKLNTSWLLSKTL